MNTNNYEQMTSNNKDDDMILGKGGSTGIGIDKVTRITKKKQGFKRLLIIIGFVVFIIILMIIALFQSAKLSKLKSLQSELEWTYGTLKLQEDEATKTYNRLNQEKEELNNRKMNLDKEINKYALKNTQINEENIKVKEQLAKLDQEYKIVYEEVKKLQSINDESKHRITDFEEQSFSYSTELDDLNKRVLELKQRLNNEPTSDKNSMNIDSKIIHTEQEMIFINSHLPDSRFTLLYRKSRDGFDPRTFHLKCDDAERTIVLLQINFNEFRYVIGGYTSNNWRNWHPRAIYKDDPSAFLFNLSQREVYKIVKSDEAIICDPNSFVIFNNDLSVGLEKIISLFPYAYESPHLQKYGLTCGFDSLSSSAIEEMEVFVVFFNK